MTDGWGISCKIALRWMPLNLTDGKSTLVQVMAWCRQATSHYLSQCWRRFMSPYGVTRSQSVNVTFQGSDYSPLRPASPSPPGSVWTNSAHPATMHTRYDSSPSSETSRVVTITSSAWASIWHLEIVPSLCPHRKHICHKQVRAVHREQTLSCDL